MSNKASAKRSSAQKAATSHIDTQTKARSFSIWYAFIILAAVTAIIYGRSVSFELTYFDDDAILLQNASRLDSLKIADAFLLDAEFGHSIDLYRPLANLSFMVDQQVWGFHPGLFHLQGILLHFLSAFLLFLIIRRISHDIFWPMIASVLFAAHPLFGITVAWLPARGDLLLAFWSLLAFYFFLEYLHRERLLYFAFSMLSCVVALFSKESAIVLPLLLTFYYYAIARKKSRLDIFLLAAIILAAGFSSFFYLRSLAVHSIADGSFGFGDLFTNLPVIPESLFYFILPFRAPLMPFYSYLPSVGGLIILAGMAVLFLRVKKHRLMIAFILLWFLMFSLPSMFYRPAWSDYCYDYCLHRSYLPLAGFFMLFSIGVKRTSRTKLRFSKVLLVAIAILFGIYSLWHITVLSNSKEFFTYATATNENSVLAWQNLANADYRKENFREAEVEYKKAVSLKSDFTDAWRNLAVLHSRLKTTNTALMDLGEVLKTDSSDRGALNLRAKIYFQTGEYQKAAETYKRMMLFGYNDYDVMYGAATGYYNAGDRDNCLASLESVMKSYPEKLPPVKLYAHVLQADGRTDDAVSAYLEVLKRENNAENSSNLGWVYFDKKNFGSAENYFNRALLQDTSSIDALLGMALVSLQKNNMNGAAEFLRKAAVHEKPLLQGMDGIQYMQKDELYYFSEFQLEQLQKLFGTVSIK